MRIDAHQHFWKYDPKEYDWINEEMSVLAKDYLPEDLEPLLRSLKLEGSVAVQALESDKNTEFLLDLAAEHSSILGVVGWLDLNSSGISERLEGYSQEKKLKGFREVLQSKSADYFLNESFIAGLNSILQKGYTYDILIFEHQIPHIKELLQNTIEKPMVIDHLAKPRIKDQDWKSWKGKITSLAERDYIYCKVSGMVTEAGWKKWNKDDFLPYMEIALELFGPDRLMFGSDWPVCTLAADYEEVNGIVSDFCQQLSETERNQIFGLTAKVFYQLKSIENGSES